MGKEKNLFDILGLIALRKSDLYNKVVERSREMNLDIDLARLEKTIAEMENQEFISEQEKKTKKLSLATRIEDLNFKVEDFLFSKDGHS